MTAYITQKQLNTLVLFKFFQSAQSDKPIHDKEEVLNFFDGNVPRRRMELALQTTISSNYIDDISDSINVYEYAITAKGYQLLEEMYLKENSQLKKIEEKGWDWFFKRRTDSDNSSEDDSDRIPGSDRFVTISDNMPGYSEISTTVEAASESIRGSNKLDASEKSWIKIHLDLGGELLQKGGKTLLSAIKSLLLEPLEAALKESSEQKMKTLIKAAITAIRTYFGI